MRYLVAAVWVVALGTLANASMAQPAVAASVASGFSAPVPPAPRPPEPPPPPGVWEAEHAPLHYAVPPQPPGYPGFAFLEGHAGRAVVTITVGADGAVWRVTLAASTGHRELDAAALAAARDLTFNKLDRTLPAYPRRARVPYNFSLPPKALDDLVLLPRRRGDGSKPSKSALQWPRAYRHPHYVAAAGANPYDNAAATVAALSRTHTLVFGRNGTLTEFVHAGTNAQQPTDIWFVLDRGAADSMAVHYTFAGAPAKPVVSIAVACPDPSSCAQVLPELLQGPFFARAASPAGTR